MIYINLIIIFLLIILIHELGHYTIARLFKTTVTDFSIGFGKVLFQFKDRYSTKWKFSLIPLGGYVKIKGLESIFNSSKGIDGKNVHLIAQLININNSKMINSIVVKTCHQ